MGNMITMTTHVAKGGLGGHLLRRITHISSMLIPFIYYFYQQILTPVTWFMSVNQLILIVLVIIMIIESLRLRHSWVLIGQRSYESYHISGFAWSICASFLVILTVKQAALAFPIIISFAIGDPLIGEMRRAYFKPYWILSIGMVVIALIWQIFIEYFGLPQWLVLIMPPITVAAEWPKLSWIDDNALMQCVPLIFVWIFTALSWI